MTVICVLAPACSPAPEHGARDGVRAARPASARRGVPTGAAFSRPAAPRRRWRDFELDAAVADADLGSAAVEGLEVTAIDGTTMDWPGGVLGRVRRPRGCPPAARSPPTSAPRPSGGRRAIGGYHDGGRPGRSAGTASRPASSTSPTAASSPCTADRFPAPALTWPAGQNGANPSRSDPGLSPMALSWSCSMIDGSAPGAKSRRPAPHGSRTPSPAPAPARRPPPRGQKPGHCCSSTTSPPPHPPAADPPA